MTDSEPSRRQSVVRRVGGCFWILAWLVVLRAIAAPWLELGGIESDFMRWLEAVVLGLGSIAGFTIGRFARDAAEGDKKRAHAALLRVVLYPPAAIAALALIGLAWAGERGMVNVVTSALLAYWAGLDAAFGAVPLMFGRPYAFNRALPDEATDDRPARARDRGGLGFPPLGGS